MKRGQEGCAAKNILELEKNSRVSGLWWEGAQYFRTREKKAL
jgi:hypothetical protein